VSRFAAFSAAEKLIYFGLIFSTLKHFENIHSQRERGFIDNESWTAWSEHVLMYFNQPGVKMWWKLRGGSFNPRFRKFLESSPPLEIITQVIGGTAAILMGYESAFRSAAKDIWELKANTAVGLLFISASLVSLVEAVLKAFNK
jgi:hypothetical protein